MTVEWPRDVVRSVRKFVKYRMDQLLPFFLWSYGDRLVVQVILGERYFLVKDMMLLPKKFLEFRLLRRPWLHVVHRRVELEGCRPEFEVARHRAY